MEGGGVFALPLEGDLEGVSAGPESPESCGGGGFFERPVAGVVESLMTGTGGESGAGLPAGGG